MRIFNHLFTFVALVCVGLLSACENDPATNNPQNDTPVITISDTGKGISPEDLPHVKEKFYKANKTVRGSGIGLAVADEIIKQHQGLLFIESTEGVGTEFTFSLKKAR